MAKGLLEGSKMNPLKIPAAILGAILGVCVLIMDSSLFKLFVELMVYLLGFFAFLFFTWLMVTGGLGWNFN